MAFRGAPRGGGVPGPYPRPGNMVNMPEQFKRFVFTKRTFVAHGTDWWPDC